MQVIADADERKSFVEEFSDAQGSKEEKSEDDVVLAGGFDERLRGGVEFGGSVHEREFVFFVETHGHGEIVLAEEKNIDSGNRGNIHRTRRSEEHTPERHAR